MTEYEKSLYDIIAKISTSDAPIVFKGGLNHYLFASIV